ncbi:MAG TPA: site-2 protease family protein [Myxococcota bacterium]
MQDPIAALAFYVVFVFSTTLHEASHAWAAKRGGDLTAYHGGQVSIDPRPHIRREPFGMVVLPVLSLLLSGWPFGFASAPYDARWARSHPDRAAWMSLAGPAANLGLILLAALLIRAGIQLDVLTPPHQVSFAHITASEVSRFWSGVGTLLGIFFSLNLVLFLLNMLPIPPLDGSGALPLLLTREAGERWREFANQPMLGWVGILIAWTIFGEIFLPVFFAAVRLLYPEMNYR